MLSPFGHLDVQSGSLDRSYRSMLKTVNTQNTNSIVMPCGTKSTTGLNTKCSTFPRSSNYVNHPLTIKAKSKFRTFHCGYHLRSKARSQLLLKPNGWNGNCEMVKLTKRLTLCNFSSSCEHIWGCSSIDSFEGKVPILTHESQFFSCRKRSILWPANIIYLMRRCMH